MVTVRLRYVHGFVDRTGRARYYFRHRGKRWPLPGQPGSAEFVARYDELLRECVQPAPAQGQRCIRSRHFGCVIEKWLASEAYTSKARHTRRQYRRRSIG